VTPDQVEEIILDALEEVNDQRLEDDGPEADLLPMDLSLAFIGTDAVVDSLELITILSAVEELLQEDGHDLDLSDDAAVAAVPWTTGEALQAYILNRLQ
jgi:hypothetical protein